MSFTMIIEDPAGRELARCSRAGNEQYLLKDGEEFPLLSNLDLSSYDVFSSDQALGLSRELLSVRDELQNDYDRAHVEELAYLAKELGSKVGRMITLTPFAKE